MFITNPATNQTQLWNLFYSNSTVAVVVSRSLPSPLFPHMRFSFSPSLSHNSAISFLSECDVLLSHTSVPSIPRPIVPHFVSIAGAESRRSRGLDVALLRSALKTAPWSWSGVESYCNFRAHVSNRSLVNHITHLLAALLKSR